MFVFRSLLGESGVGCYFVLCISYCILPYLSTCFNYSSYYSDWQRDEKITPTEVDGLYTQLMNMTNSQMNQLQKKVQEQKNAEEQERLRKIQEEMEKEKKRKEEEERKKREEEENRRK